MAYEKAKVESAAQVVERWVMARLRHQQFITVHEVNDAIAPLLERLNARPFVIKVANHSIWLLLVELKLRSC
jgi:transposase